jgi:transcriptional regulator with XRE-family HTH domain
MPNIAGVLKAEITRIAKKVAKADLMPARKQAIQIRHAIAALKRTVSEIQREMAPRIKEMKRQTVAAVQSPAAPEGKRLWIFAKGIRALRKRLGLTQAELATLVGVSAQAVTLWESKDGKLALRNSTLQSVLAVRNLRAKEARECLEIMASKKKPVPPKKAARKTAKRVVKKARGKKAKK